MEEHWKAVQSPKRLRILEALWEIGECTVTELSEHVTLSRETVHYHMQILLDAELIAELPVKRCTGTAVATMYRTLAPQGIINVVANQKSILEMHRLQKLRRSTGTLMLESYEQNVTLGNEDQSTECSFSQSSWIPVKPDVKVKIEALYKELRALINQSQLAPNDAPDERINMLYSLSITPDYVQTGPMPMLVLKSE